MAAASSVAAASRKHVELSLELKRKLIQEHEHGVPFTLLGKKYHIATSTAANIWRKKDFFLRSRMSGSRKRCNDRSKYKIVNQVTALFVKSMLERNHKIDGEVIKRFARTAAAQCNFKDFHGSNGWLDSFKKRENVCWVRRRGGAGGGAVSDRNPAMAPTQAALMQQQRSDSPNLGAAAAAAAMAASAQQHQHRPGSPFGAPWMDDNEPQHACARCNVAAAAAAVAALNASDSIHERDHEIEDWFHGIPFLCQFFEEYQSMHLSDSSSSGSSAVSTGLGGASSNSSTNNQASSSASSSSVSSSQAGPICATTGTTATRSSNLQLHFQPDPPVRSLSDAHELALDPMDDGGSSASSGGQFRASSSLADIQVAAVCAAGLQRNISIEMFVHDSGNVQMKEEPSSSTSADRQQAQYEMQPYSEKQASASIQQQSTAASSDQLMEISYQHSSGGAQQQVAMMQSSSHKPDCRSDNVNLALPSQQLISKQDCTATASSNNNNQQQTDQQQQSSDYAKVEDLEFYLPSSHTRYIPQDAQSTDDILSYHDDQVSDHNDCCSDHYDQVSGLQLNTEYQQSINGHACYMDEYEYENISTIRHYPVTAASMMQQQQISTQMSTGSCMQHFGLSSSTGGGLDTGPCVQQHRQQQQQQQQVSCELSICQSSGAGSTRNQLMSDTFLTPGSPPPPPTANSAHRTTNGYLEGSCKSAELAAINGTVEFHLAEQEPAVEHADHEEHNLLHNALMRSPEKLKLIDSIITLLNYASNYNHKMLAPLLDIKRCIERDLEVVLSDTSSENHRAASTSGASCCSETRQRQLVRRLLDTPTQDHQPTGNGTQQQQDSGKLCNGNNHLDNNSAPNSNNQHLDVSMDQRMQP